MASSEVFFGGAARQCHELLVGSEAQADNLADGEARVEQFP
jgi:hypothetical protein